MKSTLQKAVLCVAAVLVLGLVFGTQASAADKPFYQGKTLKLIVDYSAGGPTDLECRVYARHLKKHLAGNPSIVIQNRAGGGGNLAMNWIYERARRNGTVMGCQTASGRYTEWFVGDPKKAGLRANMEEIIPVMFTPVVSVGVVRKSLVPNGVQDLKTAKSFVAAGFRADSSKDLKFRALFDLAEIPYKYVNGYQGSADFIAAFARGEVDYIDGSTPFYLTRVKPVSVKAGKAVPMWYHSDVEIPAIAPGLPARTFVKMLSGKDPAGPLWQLFQVLTSYRQILAPPGVPDEAVAAVRTAFQSMRKDPAFLAEYKKSVGIEPQMLTDAKSIEKAMVPWKTADEELKKFRANYIEEGRKLAAKR
jgi:tripartite-type tricarboxylate transporter receptor subunit TctC